MSSYILNANKEPVACPDFAEWSKWMECHELRQVALTDLGFAKISTVFLALDHNFSGGTPILFETMVFSNILDPRMERYATYEQAIAGHAEMVKRVTDETH